METGFLNFHDEEHFSDFSLSLDQQHNLLGESRSSLIKMVDGDFDYVDNLGLDSNDALWETEQELNGDLAVLPVSGVSGIIPKIENMKEDYAKVLTDWQEHIGYLQASEIEEDIDLVSLDMGLQMNADLDDNIFEKNLKSTMPPLNSTIKHENVSNFSTSTLNNYIKLEANHHAIESDQSEKEIDVVGLDTVDDIVPFDFMHVRRQVSNPSKEIISKCLDKTAKEIKQEFLNITVKEEPVQLGEDESQTSLPSLQLDFAKCNKKKYSKKIGDEIPSKKSRKTSKVANETAKKTKRSKTETKCEKFIQKPTNCSKISLSHKKDPVLEAGDVKSLLEQFEATEAAASTLEIHESISPQRISSNKDSYKPSVNKSQITLLKKSTNLQESKLHRDIRDSLPKEVIDRIKASGRKKVISVIPAMPNTKSSMRNNGTRMQEAGATLSRNKLLKLVANKSSIARTDGSVQLDHDYCSNSSSSITSNSSNSSSSHGCNSSNSSDCNSEYDRLTSDSEQLTPTKEESCTHKTDYYGKVVTEAPKSGYTLKDCAAMKKNWIDNSSKKDSGLESGDLSDASEEQTPADRIKKSLLQDVILKEPIKELKKTIVQMNVCDNNNKISMVNKPVYPTNKPVYEMKIQSALATSILQLRKGVITKTKSLDSCKPKQMVSVLKKPPISNIPQKIPGTSLMESIVTTTNSSNDQVQNIIIQDTADIEMPEETEKKPPRRKLNLAEYRSRREQNRSDGSRTNSPVQPMTLVYIHHVSTNTEPINNDSENPIWSEREIVSVLKPKSEIEEEKVRPKPPTRERGMQTIETVFGIAYEEKEDIEEEEIQQQLEEKEKEKEMESVEDGEIQEKHPIVEDEDVPIEQRREEGKEIECVEPINECVVNKQVATVNSSDNDIEILSDKVKEDTEKIQQTTSINRMRDRKHRNYRTRPRASSESSQSRSRSRSRVRASRVLCHSAQSSASKSTIENCSRSRSPSRSHSRSQSRNRNRSRSRTSSSNRSRSRSESRSRGRRHSRRRRRISHRRSSVSSSSSWSSRSRSRSRSRSSRRYKSSSRSSSSSRNSRSRSRSSRYSSCSRSSSRSNIGRSKWSSRRRKLREESRRSYDRHRWNSSGSSHGYNDWRRSPLPSYRRPYDEWYIKEKQRQVEERRVIYVGRLKEGITKAELRRRFEAFGPVVDISVHFRERGHNYGFVTFAYKNDAYAAVEHGNDDPTLPRYDLCFGGRRAFCKVKYADLDGAAGSQLGGSSSRSIFKPEEENTFDLLLKEAQAKLRKRKV